MRRTYDPKAPPARVTASQAEAYTSLAGKAAHFATITVRGATPEQLLALRSLSLGPWCRSDHYGATVSSVNMR